MVDRPEVKIIKLPLTKKEALQLKAGDFVFINGLLFTGRDKVHKFLFHEKPPKKDMPFNTEGAIIYHCGPIIKSMEDGYKIIAAGPTTSIRVEMYEGMVIEEYGISGIMGKGGMGQKTLEALQRNKCVYFQTIGGAAVYLAERVKRVTAGWKIEEFGMAEAMWQLEVEGFPAIVTMDAHGKSLHQDIEKTSAENLKNLLI